MNFKEIKAFFSNYFGGLPNLKRAVKNLVADIKLEKINKERKLS